MDIACLFIILQVSSIALSYESESEILLRREKEFLSDNTNSLNNSIDEQSQSKSKIPKKFSPTTAINGTSLRPNNSSKLTKYVEHIKKQGVKTLNYIGKDIMNETKQNISTSIEIVTDTYLTKIQNYFNYISGPKSLPISDKDFIILDISEIASRIMYHQQRRMLTDVIIAANLTDIDNMQDYSASIESFHIMTNKSNKAQIDSIKNITETIFKYNTDLRKKEMKYICIKYKVCRPYPSLTDYCGYFLNEILRLPNRQFQIITKLMGMMLSVNGDVREIISDIGSYEKFATRTDQICNNETNVKETLEVLKAVLSQKFSIVRNPALDFKMRAPAIRILLDIIDQSFKGKQHDEFVIVFDKAVTAIRKWAQDEIASIALDAGQLLDRIFKMLNGVVHSPKTDRKYLMILFEMIREGTSEHYAYNYVHKTLI